MGLLIPVLLWTRIKGPGVVWDSEPSQPCLLDTASSSPRGLMAWLPDLFPEGLCILLPAVGRIGARPENTLARWPYPKFPSQGPDFRVLSKQRSGVVGCPQTRRYKLEQEVKKYLMFLELFRVPWEGDTVITNTGETGELRVGELQGGVEAPPLTFTFRVPVFSAHQETSSHLQDSAWASVGSRPQDPGLG